MRQGKDKTWQGQGEGQAGYNISKAHLVIWDDDHDDLGLGVEHHVEPLDVGGGPGVVQPDLRLWGGEGEAEAGGAFLHLADELLDSGLVLGGVHHGPVPAERQGHERAGK